MIADVYHLKSKGRIIDSLDFLAFYELRRRSKMAISTHENPETPKFWKNEINL